MAIKEVELAKVAVDWLRTKYGYDNVYQEVPHHLKYGSGAVIDIVVDLGEGGKWAIEAKTSLNLEVLAQADYNRRAARLSSIFVPSAKASAGRALAYDIARTRGLGIIECSIPKGFFSDKAEYLSSHCSIREIISPKENREMIHIEVVPEMRDYAEAGTSSGKHVSAFTLTVDAIRANIEEKGPRKIRDIFKEIDHHYSSLNSACGSMRKWIGDGKVPGLVITSDGEVFLRS